MSGLRGLFTMVAVTLLAFGGATCSSGAGDKPADAAAETRGDAGADGEEDCQRNGCTDDMECQECLGQDGETVFVCVPADSAC